MFLHLFNSAQQLLCVSVSTGAGVGAVVGAVFGVGVDGALCYPTDNSCFKLLAPNVSPTAHYTERYTRAVVVVMWLARSAYY